VSETNRSKDLCVIPACINERMEDSDYCYWHAQEFPEPLSVTRHVEAPSSKDVVLLACPFCGGSVEVGHYHPDLGPSSCFVKCWCGARGTEHQYQHGDHKEAIAKAAASWNRRTVETQPATHAVRENNELSANNEAQPAASNDKPGPWWTPTAEVERLMKWCKDANTITLEISTKVLEGLLYDSLLWRKDRAAQPMKPDETSEPYLHDRANGVHGVYCIGRIRNGTTEYWTGREWAAFCGDLYFDLRPAVEPFGVRIAPEKPIIDGHPIGCMCHGCHYYRKHPQCKPVKAPVCTCDSPAAGPCPAHT